MTNAAAERTPYGRGDQTLVDESVRKVCQIPPEKISFESKSWASRFDELVTRVAEGLGLAPKEVRAEFYKLRHPDSPGNRMSLPNSESAACKISTTSREATQTAIETRSEFRRYKICAEIGLFPADPPARRIGKSPHWRHAAEFYLSRSDYLPPVPVARAAPTRSSAQDPPVYERACKRHRSDQIDMRRLLALPPAEASEFTQISERLLAACGRV